jgi:hypothetical protein
VVYVGSLNNERLRNLYASPDIIRMMRGAGHVARVGEMRNAYKILIVKPGGRGHAEDFGVDGKKC